MSGPQLAEPTGGGGGFLELGGRAVFLSPVQLELAELLVARAKAERRLPPSVRGYIRSSELLASSISWSTTKPDGHHLKQLIRRLRRKLASAGVSLSIEARPGLGYRLIGTAGNP